jgi:NAD(P)-dependent dehydrogenase (short-subunit alcohol dehydrogenase family)
MGRLDGKVALITTDETGLALAVAVGIGREGARVAITDTAQERLDIASGAVAQTGAECLPILMDPTHPASCERAISALMATFGRLDVLCNLAGSFRLAGPLHEVSEAEWDLSVAENLKSVLLVSRFAVPAIRQSGTSGSVINLSHVAALNGVPGTSLIAATKGALLNMTRDMAIQGSREGFRVNCVCVGSTFAPAIPSLLEQHSAHPSPPSDLAMLLVYLASDESRHVTGSIITIDDGMHAWR